MPLARQQRDARQHVCRHRRGTRRSDFVHAAATKATEAWAAWGLMHARGSADATFKSQQQQPQRRKPRTRRHEGRVPYKGSLVGIVYQLAGGLRAAMGYCGAASLSDMQQTRSLYQITAAGMRETTRTTCKSPKKHPTTAPTKHRRPPCPTTKSSSSTSARKSPS